MVRKFAEIGKEMEPRRIGSYYSGIFTQKESGMRVLCIHSPTEKNRISGTDPLPHLMVNKPYEVTLIEQHFGRDFYCLKGYSIRIGFDSKHFIPISDKENEVISEKLELTSL